MASRLLRLFLGAVPGEMDGERAALDGRVLPVLRARAREMGVEIVVVDPSAAPGEWDLARRLQEIERCELFVALLGERYGEPPPTIPPAVMAAQPWLAGTPGWSLVELEIEHGALRHAQRGTATFFYFRDPGFPALAPDQQRGRFLAENERAAVRLASLKERIRASGQPLFDGYPCGASDGLGRATRMGTFAERVLADLWKAVQERVHEPRPSRAAAAVTATRPPAPPPPAITRDPAPGPEPPRRHLPPDRPLPVHENVQFTVYRPRAVEPMKWFPLLAFAHLAELPSDAPPDAADPAEEVRKQAGAVLGDLAGGYADVKQDSRVAIPDEAEITFLPEIPGFDVNPPRRTFLWLESLQREEFRIRAPARLQGTAVRGRLSVFWGSILLAEVSLAIRVDTSLAATVPPARAASRPFRCIFPSYSHRDARIVEELERYARTLGDRYLRDVHELRAGEVWNDRLKDLIQQADVFQLFWSWNAMRSPYVEEEWRYALSLGRPHFVRPTHWEVPLPEEPARRLPPDDLRRLHFQLLSGSGAPREVERTAGVRAAPQAPAPAEPGHELEGPLKTGRFDGDSTATGLGDWELRPQAAAAPPAMAPARSAPPTPTGGWHLPPSTAAPAPPPAARTAAVPAVPSGGRDRPPPVTAALPSMPLQRPPLPTQGYAPPAMAPGRPIARWSWLAIAIAVAALAWLAFFFFTR
jgi:hypothetical protein